MIFQIKSRWSSTVKFECELDASLEGQAYGVQLGAAIKLALKADANLTGAVLTDANLTGADLTGANLTRADLTGADLTDAVLYPIRDDLWAVLCSAPNEVPALREALLAGRVDGSAYEGDCACLVGTLANVRGCKYTDIPGLRPNSSRAAERWFMAIRPGHTPENSIPAKLAVEWVDEWMANVQAAFAGKARP